MGELFIETSLLAAATAERDFVRDDNKNFMQLLRLRHRAYIDRGKFRQCWDLRIPRRKHQHCQRRTEIEVCEMSVLGGLRVRQARQIRGVSSDCFDDLTTKSTQNDG